MLNCRVADRPPSSTTRSVNTKVPAVVGVPVIRPGAVVSDNPGGSVPLRSDQRQGGIPPSANTPVAYGTPTRPGASSPNGSRSILKLPE